MDLSDELVFVRPLRRDVSGWEEIVLVRAKVATSELPQMEEQK